MHTQQMFPWNRWWLPCGTGSLHGTLIFTNEERGVVLALTHFILPDVNPLCLRLRKNYLSCVGEGVYRFNHMPDCDIRVSMFLYSICSVVGNSASLRMVTLVVTERQ